MLAVVIVDLGIACGLLALVGLALPIRRLGLATRRRSLLLLLVAATISLTGILLPAPARHADAGTPSASRLDAIIPTWQFSERHEIEIHSAPERVEAAIRAVTAREISLFRLLTWLRNPRLPGGHTPDSILAAPADEPILAVALRSGFMLLAEGPGELVFGSLVMVPQELRALPPAERERLRGELTAARFAALSAPGYAKAVMGFRWTEQPTGTVHLVTETRVLATDASSKRRFAAYWRTIYPGSSLIRRSWLRAIRNRAENGPPPA